MATDKRRDAACLKDIPQLVTEGVSEYLTDYQRPGYTEDTLREFVVLDDIEAKKANRKANDEERAEADQSPGDPGDDEDDDDDEDEDEEGTMSEGSSEDEGDNSDVPLEEVDMMLEEGLPEDYKVRGEKLPNGKYAKKLPQNSYVNRRLQVIDEIFSNPFDVLPEGWVRVTHNTGIPIYLHKESRVCTTAPPYFLGPGSARKHRVPLSAIPCLQYRKALDKEKAAKEEQETEKAEITEIPRQGDEEQEADSEPPRKKAKMSDEREADGLENGEKENAAGSENGEKETAGGNETSADDPVAVIEDVPMETGEPSQDRESKEKEPEIDEVQPTAESNGLVCPKEDDVTARNELIERLTEPVSGSCPVSAGAPALPKARIETAQENQETQSINHIELREYCQRLFRYRTIDVMRFKTWSERRRFAKVKKKERQLQRPSLPEGTKLITFPILEPAGEDSTGNRIKKEWIMNPSGKSYVCILHECVQHALKTQPVYEFKDLENPATPYSATVSINKMKYGTGVGTSKRQAKSEAARATLEVLIPEMREKMDEDAHRGGAGLSRNQHTDLSFFDDIKIQDPRVHEFCAKTTEPSPYTILLTCLKRNFGMGDMDITCEVKMLRHQKNEFTMSVGNHTATVICKNKREGKQRASQAILQAMHPHITSWGSLLRLYGNRSVKTLREKKQEEQEITTLQSRASANSPNWAILNKLKDAMLKLKERNAAVKPLGTFIPPSNVDLPMASASNLNNLEL